LRTIFPHGDVQSATADVVFRRLLIVTELNKHGLTFIGSTFDALRCQFQTLLK
jgi:hypothetical protein